MLAGFGPWRRGARAETPLRRRTLLGCRAARRATRAHSGPLATTVPRPDINRGGGGGVGWRLRSEGTHGPQLIGVEGRQSGRKPWGWPRDHVREVELPPRGRAGVSVGFDLTVPPPSRCNGTKGRAERPHCSGAAWSPGMLPHVLPSRASQQGLRRVLQYVRGTHKRHLWRMTGHHWVRRQGAPPLISPGSQVRGPPVISTLVVEEREGTPGGEVARSAAGGLPDPKQHRKGEGGERVGDPVLAATDCGCHVAPVDKLCPDLRRPRRSCKGLRPACHEPELRPNGGGYAPELLGRANRRDDTLDGANLLAHGRSAYDVLRQGVSWRAELRPVRCKLPKVPERAGAAQDCALGPRADGEGEWPVLVVRPPQYRDISSNPAQGKHSVLFCWHSLGITTRTAARGTHLDVVCCSPPCPPAPPALLKGARSRGPGACWCWPCAATGHGPVVVTALTAWVGRGAGRVIRAPSGSGGVQMYALLTLLPPALGAGIVAVPRPVAVPPETSPRRPRRLAQGRSLWLGRRVLWLGIPLLHLGLRRRRLLLLLRLALAVQDALDCLRQGPGRRLRVVGSAVLPEGRENVTLPGPWHSTRLQPLQLTKGQGRDLGNLQFSYAISKSANLLLLRLLGGRMLLLQPPP